MKRWSLLAVAVIVGGLAALPQTRESVWPFVATVLAVGPSPASTISELALVETTPLGNVKGRIDHMAVDLMRRRLFIAELGNNSVGVVDVSNRTVVDRINGLKEPQGLAYSPKWDRLFIANGDDGSIDIREGAKLKPVGKIALGDDADNIRLDGPDRVLVGYGNALAVLAAATGEKIADFPLAGHPEAFMPEPGGERIFVNEPNALRIAEIDKRSGVEIARWGASGALANFPMALDAADHLLFVVYRMPAAIAAFDTAKGELVAQQPTCRDADDVFHDTARSRIYVICGEGAVAVLDARDDKLRELARLRTRPGARTGLFVPELDRLFVALPANAGDKAELRAYQPH